MFGFGRRVRESVSVSSRIDTITDFEIKNPKLIRLWHSSPEDWSPYSLEFEQDGQRYKFEGIWRLKHFCKAVKRYGLSYVHLHATVRVRDLKQDRPNAWIGEILLVIG